MSVPLNQPEPRTEAEGFVSRETWQQSLAQLYDRTAPRLLLYGRALGLGHGEAEDVLHDVFAALLRLDTPPLDEEHYLVRAFRNGALNHRRGWWRRLVRELESSRWFEVSEPASAQESAAVRCLVRLPVEQREVIVLKLWHQRTFEEIAALQHVSPNTAAGRYRYGLQKLRLCLSQTSPESDLEDENISSSELRAEVFEIVAAPSACPGSSSAFV